MLYLLTEIGLSPLSQVLKYDMIWYMIYDMIYDMLYLLSEIGLSPLSQVLQYDIIWYDMLYLLTEIGLSPGGSTHLHTNNTQNNTNNK